MAPGDCIATQIQPLQSNQKHEPGVCQAPAVSSTGELCKESCVRPGRTSGDMLCETQAGLIAERSTSAVETIVTLVLLASTQTISAIICALQVTFCPCSWPYAKLKGHQRTEAQSLNL